MRFVRWVLSASLFLLSPSSFLLGGQVPQPLPDLETFSRTARENLARAERVAHLYAFKERRTDVHANPFGRIGTGGTRVFAASWRNSSSGEVKSRAARCCCDCCSAECSCCCPDVSLLCCFINQSPVRCFEIISCRLLRMSWCGSGWLAI